MVAFIIRCGVRQRQKEYDQWIMSIDEVNANWDYIRSLMKDVNGKYFSSLVIA